MEARKSWFKIPVHVHETLNLPNLICREQILFHSIWERFQYFSDKLLIILQYWLW